jgi:hypothetical protein
MNKQQKRREQILRKMAGIKRMEKGRLAAEYRETIREGKTVRKGPYYKHQYWEQGHNVSRRVPVEEAETLREAVENYHEFRQLSDEYADLTIQMTRRQTGALQGKKKPG